MSEKKEFRPFLHLGHADVREKPSAGRDSWLAEYSNRTPTESPESGQGRTRESSPSKSTVAEPVIGALVRRPDLTPRRDAWEEQRVHPDLSGGHEGTEKF